MGSEPVSVVSAKGRHFAASCASAILFGMLSGAIWAGILLALGCALSTCGLAFVPLSLIVPAVLTVPLVRAARRPRASIACVIALLTTAGHAGTVSWLFLHFVPGETGGWIAIGGILLAAPAAAPACYLGLVEARKVPSR